VEVQSIDFDTSDIQFEPDQRFYILEQTYDVRIQRTGTAQVVTQFPGNTFTVEEVDGDPTGAVNKLVVSNGTLTIAGNTATIDTGGGADVQYHDRYSTEAESERSGATATLEIYYTARPDGDGYAESEVSDVGETDTINRTLYYSTKFQADPDTAGDWTEYTTQPANNATFATAKAALLAGLNETDATAETRGTLPLSLKMVRTTTAAVTDLLLDTYTGAAAAYSVRKLDKDYTGSCMRIRRASDDAETDIGFDSNGDLDTSAISTHGGASSCFVTTWYDQSGNSNNATQSTPSDQPQIYNGTAVITEGTRPAIEFDKTNDQFLRLASTSYLTNTNNMGFFTVCKSTSNPNSFTCAAVISDLNNYYVILANNTARVKYHSIQNSGSGNSNHNLFSVYADNASSDVKGYINGSQVISTTPVSQTAQQDLFIGRLGTLASTGWDGTIQEVIVWDTSTKSNQTAIESDIDTYFNIP
jgi:hypothetical protein